MSIGSLGLLGALASSPIAQKAAEADKTAREATDAARQAGGELQAESAAGIGQTEEDAEASERDADGRRLWEAPPTKQPPEPPADAAIPQAKDPTGETGGELDLLG